MLGNGSSGLWSESCRLSVSPSARRSLRIPNLQANNAGCKIDCEPADREYVPADKEVVWRFPNGKTRHVKLKSHTGPRPEKLQIKTICGNGLPPDLAEIAFPRWIKVEAISEALADYRDGRACIDEGLNDEISGSADTHFDGRPMLEKLVDRLSDVDFGPRGFFIICHRGL